VDNITAVKNMLLVGGNAAIAGHTPSCRPKQSGRRSSAARSSSMTLVSSFLRICPSSMPTHASVK